MAMCLDSNMALSTRESAGSLPGPECGFEGNFETYGLGVRLGIYLSWLSIIIAAAWFPKIIAELTDGLIIFLVAFLAATILVSIQREQTHTIEIIIMAYLYFGGIVTASMSILAAGVRKPSEKHPVSLWRGTIMSITAIAMGIYCFWFYWGAQPFLDTPCGTWVFPFGHVETASFRHGPVLIYAILSAIVGVSWSFAAVTALVLFSPDMVTILAKVFSKDSVNPRPHRHWYGKVVAKIGKGVKVRFLQSRQLTRGRSDKSKRISRHIILAISVSAFVWSITGVELMLKKNSVTKVNALATTGQLIPFIIGVATVTKLAYNAVSEGYKPPQLIWGFFFYDEQKVFDGHEGVNLIQVP